MPSNVIPASLQSVAVPPERSSARLARRMYLDNGTLRIHRSQGAPFEVVLKSRWMEKSYSSGQHPHAAGAPNLCRSVDQLANTTTADVPRSRERCCQHGPKKVSSTVDNLVGGTKDGHTLQISPPI